VLHCPPFALLHARVRHVANYHYNLGGGVAADRPPLRPCHATLITETRRGPGSAE
jgi:hypothetical protein